MGHVLIKLLMSLLFIYARWRWCHSLVKVFVPIYVFVKTITDIALELTTLIHHHSPLQQRRVLHKYVKVSVRIMAVFNLEFWLSFWYNSRFFKTFSDIALKLSRLFTIVTSSNRQEYITLSMLL